MPHKRSKQSASSQKKKQRIEDFNHVKTVEKLIAAKATGRLDLGPAAEHAEKAIQKLQNVSESGSTSGAELTNSGGFAHGSSHTDKNSTRFIDFRK